MISNLPIVEGEEVVGFVLESTQGSPNGGCHYATGLWRPLSPPIFGTYDDFGMIKNIELRSSGEFFIDAIRRGDSRYYIERSQGSGEVAARRLDKLLKDHTAEPNKILSAILRVVERGCLSSKALYEHWDRVVSSNERGVIITANLYHRLKLILIHRKVYNLFIEWNHFEFNRSKEHELAEEAVKKLFAIESSKLPLHMLFNSSEYLNTLVPIISGGWEYRGILLGAYSDTIIKAIEKKDIESCSSFFKDCVDAALITVGLEHTRKIWMPTGGKGGQDMDIDLRKNLAEFIKNHKIFH